MDGDTTVGAGYPKAKLTLEWRKVREKAAVPTQSLMGDWGLPNPWIQEIEDDDRNFLQE